MRVQPLAMTKMTEQLEQNKQRASEWFKELRDRICASFEEIDGAKFEQKQWQRDGGGGGEICSGGG